MKGEFGGPFDAVYASAVFLHFTPTELARVLTSALRATRPGGVLPGTLKKGDGGEWSTHKMDAPLLHVLAGRATALFAGRLRLGTSPRRRDNGCDLGRTLDHRPRPAPETARAALGSRLNGAYHSYRS